MVLCATKPLIYVVENGAAGNKEIKVGEYEE